jgi:uncharacterized protein (DUF433 family)
MSIMIDANPVPLRADTDGVLRVGQTRVTLDTIIAAHRRGDTPEAIVEQYPAVSRSDVYAVIGFYLRRRDEVDAYLDQRRREADALRQEMEEHFPHQEFRERVLARARQQGHGEP